MSEKDFDINQKLSFVTSKVVLRLIDWKRKREMWKKRKFIFDVVTLFVMFFIIIKVYFQLASSNDLAHFYAVLFSPSVTNAIIILIPIMIVWKFLNVKYREVDDDYETLRKEVIDRADELWFHYPEDLSSRQEVLQQIDKIHGVNLFYKKK